MASCFISLCILAAVFIINTKCLHETSGESSKPEFCDLMNGRITNFQLGCVFNGTINKANDYKITIKINVPSHSLQDLMPFVSTMAELATNSSVLTSQVIMDVVAYTNANPTVWSHKNDGNHRISRYIFVSPSTFDNQRKKNTTIAFVFTTSTGKAVNFHASISLKNISLGLGMKKKEVLSYRTPILYKFKSPMTDQKRFRVQVTRNDITQLREQTKSDNGCSSLFSPETCFCSVVGIQSLENPFHIQEDDISFKSRWQNMIGISVIDIDVASMNNEIGNLSRGFYVVILKRANDLECMSNKRKRVQLNHDSNSTMDYHSSFPDDEYSFEFEIEITPLDEDILKESGIIAGACFAFFVAILIASNVCGLIGKVSIHKRHKPFSLLLRMFPLVDVSSHELESTSNDPLLEDPKDLDLVKGYYIEIIEGDDEDIPIENEKRVDEDEHIETSGCILDENHGEPSISKSKLKFALDIDARKPIRIESLPNQQKLNQIRRNKDANLDSFSTLCDNSLSSSSLHLKTDMYFWIVVISGIFYILPTIQLMFAAQRRNDETGDHDFCYYNFLCRVESTLFDDYGHVFSNIFYISFGSLFIILVLIRRRTRRNAMVDLYCERHYPSKTINKSLVKFYVQKKLFANHKNIQFVNKCGIPEQYGLYFAMGGAVVLEGILSSCYHICPVDESFQFDTTFIYVSIALCFLKMFQFRHPDISVNAHVAFCFIAVALIFEAMGYYSPPNIYLGVFLTFFIGTVICVLSIICQLKKNTRGRNALLISLLCLNFILAGLIGHKMFMSKDVVVSDFLMFLFGANYIVYAIYYGLSKYYYVLKIGRATESLTFTCWMYIVLSTAFAISGMYFFVSKQKKTGLSSSESRHLNSECMFWFFDYHDVWHFASALAIFFQFMVLLTLEDNNTCTPWNEIPVF